MNIITIIIPLYVWYHRKMAIATPTEMGGYDYKFVDTLHNRFICTICHLASRDPYLSECCGHLFCKSCLDNVKKASKVSNACPICRDEEFKTFCNKAIDREIRSFHVYCTNKEKGCEWQGEVNNISNHLGNSDGCQFEEMKCSNECGKMAQRRYLTSHVETECPRRKVNCQYCHDPGEHQFIEGQHKDECPKLPLACPNKCEVGSLSREDMEAHRKECPLEMIQCEYHSVGCEVRMARKDLENHDNVKMKDHLMMTKCKLDNTQNELTDTKAQLTVALKQMTNLTLLMNAQMNFNNRHTNLRSVYLVSMATILKCGDQVCPVTIMMPEYNINKKDESGWCSDSFYTCNKGYKMCLMVYAAGSDDNIGTPLLLYLYLMKGPHDDELTWPLKKKFEIKLLNQISNSRHYSCKINYDDVEDDDVGCRIVDDDGAGETGWGLANFITNKLLYKTTSECQYLKDDSLFFQISIC